MTPPFTRGAYIWESGFSVDADGAPRAYGGLGLTGLDALANAGKPGKWYGVVTNSGKPDGEPVVQGPADPAPGFYVSSTSLVDPRYSTEHDPRRYVDASKVPYIAVPPELLATHGGQLHLGDLACVVYKGKQAGAVIADIGPAGHLGEGSIALATLLGIPNNPRNGGVSWGVTWLAFANSRANPPWPRDLAEVQSQAKQLFADWGGTASVAWMAPNC